MRYFYLVALAGIMGVSLLGCNGQQADKTAETTEAVSEKASQVTENAAGEVGKSAEEVGKPSGEAGHTASNSGVTAKIKNAILLSTAIDNTKSVINVDTTDTEVVLKGDVMTKAESQEAEKLAKANAGNRTVKNQLHVGDHKH
jgi:osmotically-inducible protein OsmY